VDSGGVKECRKGGRRKETKERRKDSKKGGRKEQMKGSEG
jgi:hypothetical protein